MFTGLVEHRGLLEQITLLNPGVRFYFRGGITAQGTKIGDSIAVNGCCLTVVDINGEVMAFEAGTETLSRTNLGALRPGHYVNLERSLAVGDRLGGHYVTGHIDGTGTLDSRVDEGAWSSFWFKAPRDLMTQIVSKGSIAVDGVSLTVVDVEERLFSAALIPHTLANTTLGALSPGGKVNLETDLIAKYVEKQMAWRDTQIPF